MSHPGDTTSHGNDSCENMEKCHSSELQAAMEWQIILWSGEVTPQERQAFTSWLNASPSHQQAWQQLQQIHDPFSHIPSDIAGRALRASGPDTRRRQLLLGFVVLVGIGGSGYGIQRTSHWQAATADYTTRRGETRSVTLPDGTAITLNTDSAVDVTFTDSQRTLHLRQGEVMIATAPDRATVARPFMVSTRSGQVRPIGTRFSVRQYDDAAGSVLVQVLEGAIELAPRSSAGMRIDAGQQARFDQHQVTLPTPADMAKSAWTRGLLIAEQQRLDDFLAELGRYRVGVLRCDPAVASLVVSGVYPLRDTDQVLQALEQALPIRIHTLTRYWVTISAS